MKSSKFIFVANNFENRSSGVVYEALSMNKTVISIKDKFMIEMKKISKNIFIIDDINELPFLIKNKSNSKISAISEIIILMKTLLYSIEI